MSISFELRNSKADESGSTEGLPKILQILLTKRQCAADECVQNDAQRPNVRLAAVVLLALKELWRGVWQGAAEGVQKCARFVVEGEEFGCDFDSERENRVRLLRFQQSDQNQPDQNEGGRPFELR